MLIVRYSAFFNADISSGNKYFELVISLMTVNKFLQPYVGLKVIIYTMHSYKKSFEVLLEKYGFSYEVWDLDAMHPQFWHNSVEFSKSLSNLTEIDKICTVRMLSDFHLLDKNAYRLLIGADVYFLGIPDEVLGFVWSGSAEKKEKILYMRDMYTFGGFEYKIRHWAGEHLSGLLGDFYCLAPEVTLDVSAVQGCLRMIDSWPVVPSRYDPTPPHNLSGVTTPEQQAASLLLAPFGGTKLPANRYSHYQYFPELVLLHSHTLAFPLTHLGDEFVREFVAIIGVEPNVSQLSGAQEPILSGQ
ncbi:hypothetical protein NKW53_08785 [Acetobacter orientalis]|uniref:hypothetical protein n=1 Tax=Acetobacter orientalis TaxID=146474 RepID=UPI0020A16191|nr:hypothetical protein [Acetobacter orientalis]MCP1216157.1 hypothetical protein [Acetobacter orientalis]MCP1219046.1 hypothetical protein [Acetobacter orientalis]